MLEYNTERKDLPFKSYGRNVQKLVKSLIKIEDREKRTNAAKAVVRTMAQFSPMTIAPIASNHTKDVEEYWHKIWDHLFMISGNELDIDSPFPKPNLEANNTPTKTSHNYAKSKITYRTYGRNLENIIKTISEYPEEIRKAKAFELANQLKKFYLNYNRNSVNDQLIIAQLRELSEGKIDLPDNTELRSNKEIISTNSQSASSTSNGKKKKKKNKNKNKNRNQQA